MKVSGFRCQVSGNGFGKAWGKWYGAWVIEIMKLKCGMDSYFIKELFRQDLQDFMDFSFQAFLLARHRNCSEMKAG